MSTYKPRFKDKSKVESPEQVLFNNKRDITIKELRKWISNQNWTSQEILSYETSIRGMNKNEIMVLIHGSNTNIEDILKVLKTINFKTLGMNIEYTSYEQASWNKSTYFIDFTFLG